MLYKITRGATTKFWVTRISDPLQMYSGRLDEHDWWYAILDIIFFFTKIVFFNILNIIVWLHVKNILNPSVIVYWYNDMWFNIVIGFFNKIFSIVFNHLTVTKLPDSGYSFFGGLICIRLNDMAQSYLL
jgi:hypothetical protein